jgi:hypothetical protein
MNDSLIPAEIKNDELYEKIIETIHLFNSEIKTVLEVGASSGDGSTEALVLGMSHLQEKTLYTIEANPLRFKSLSERYKNLDWVKPLNGSSVNSDEYMRKGEVETFYKLTPTQLNEYSLDIVQSWLSDEESCISKWGIPSGLIDKLTHVDKITFDLALLDGSAFSGFAEYLKIAGTKIIILDDILSIKHYVSNKVLRNNFDYECLFCNLTLRNGYSIWVKKELL